MPLDAFKNLDLLIVNNNERCILLHTYFQMTSKILRNKLAIESNRSAQHADKNIANMGIEGWL